MEKGSSNFRRAVALLLMFGLLLFGIGVFMAGCSSSDDGNSDPCPDEDYPLYCPDSGSCCPPGYSVYCGGKCYRNTSEARQTCDSSIDTCSNQ